MESPPSPDKKDSLKKQESFKYETKYIVLRYLYQTPRFNSFCVESPDSVDGQSSGFHGQSDLETDGPTDLDETDSPFVGEPTAFRATGPQRGDRTKLSLDLTSSVSPVGHDFTPEDVSEITREIEQEVTPEMERIKQAGIDSPVFKSTTPQTEVATLLSHIGDEVNDMYGDRIKEATTRMLCSSFCYSSFQSTASTLLENVPGWKQVALLLSFSQQVAFNCVKKGEKHLSDIGEYTTDYIMERAADFIINEGGWGAVSSVVQDSPVFESTPPFSDKQRKSSTNGTEKNLQ